MKLRNVGMLALLGVLASSAGAMAIPLPQRATADTGAIETEKWWNSAQKEISRFSAGDTLTVDARLGHASIAKGSDGETYLFAQVSGGEAKNQASSAPPVNLAVVVDRSGSMKGARIGNAINAAVAAVERMREGDSVTVVSFDTRASVVVPPTRVSSATRAGIESDIRSIRLGGDTCISCGLEEAMHQLNQTSLGGDRVNRMILLSDGATNSGIRDIPGLRALASRMRDRGCAISTIGVDVDFDEKIMAAIANESNGRHYFVENASALPAIFEQEFDSLLASVARDAELEVELGPGVEVEEVFDRTFRREGGRVVVPFGTFSGGQEKTVLMKLRVPTDRDGVQAIADMKLSYRDLTKSSDQSTTGNLALVVKSDGSAQGDLDPFVEARLERSRTAQTLVEANRLFEQGDVTEARKRLDSHRTQLEKSKKESLALAPRAVAPRHARALDRDFDDQLGAIASAEKNFAGPSATSTAAPADAFLGGAPSGGAAQAQGRFAEPPPATRAGKAQVRANQAAATEFGF